jgi:hypothetical protein
MLIKLSNDFHNTTATLRVQVGKSVSYRALQSVSYRALQRARAKLCSADCYCGKIRGKQEWEDKYYIEWRMDADGNIVPIFGEIR